MKVKRIEVLPHARNPAGSFAVIKLYGISRLEGPATFTLEPAAPGGNDAVPGWPIGDLKPLGVRAGPETVELLIGPEIVKASALQPGTPVRFHMASIDADATFDWPELSANTTDDLPGGPIKLEDRPQVSANASRGTSSAPLPPSATAGNGDANGARLSASPQRGLARLQPRGVAASAKPGPDTVAASGAQSAGKPELPITVPTAASSHAGFRQRVEAENRVVAPRRALSVVPLAIGMVIVAAMLLTFLRTTEVEGSGVTLFSALRSAVGTQMATTKADHQPERVLAEILTVGSTSPSGIDASGISQQQALERANELLATAKTPKERTEATFWLRRALSHRLSEPRLIWAVTQLGTAYASVDKDTKPNYEAARLLWSWAADAGDAQAACFLGQLHERGLGVPSNAKIARQTYERARSMGGCPGLEQAMLRVRN